MLRYLLIGWWLMCFATASHSASLLKTNEGIVAVTSKGQEKIRALKQVMVKMTGTETVLAHPEIRKALSDADKYVLSYEYFIDNNERFYRATFDRNKIELILRAASQPIWGPRRPDTLVWLAIRQNEDLNIVSDLDNNDIRDAIMREAMEKGVSVFLPLMDLDDQLALSPSDIWGRFVPQITLASNRYNAEFVISARIIDTTELTASQSVTIPNKPQDHSIFFPKKGARAFDRGALTLDIALSQAMVFDEEPDTTDTQIVFNVPKDKAFAIEWMLLGDDQHQVRRSFGHSPASLIAGVLSEYAFRIGKQYAISPLDSEKLNPTVTVSNIRNIADVNILNRYLDDLTVVQSAELTALKGNVVTFNVSLIGSLIDFNNALSLDERLVEVNTNDIATSSTSNLHFYWNK